MTVQDKNFFLRYVEACNQKDVELADRWADEYISGDCVNHSPGSPAEEWGNEGQKKFMRAMIAANPDLHISVDALLFDGDYMIIRGTYQTNNPDSGAVDTTAFIEIDRLAGGKIAESWLAEGPGQW